MVTHSYRGYKIEIYVTLNGYKAGIYGGGGWLASIPGSGAFTTQEAALEMAEIFADLDTLESLRLASGRE